MWETSLEPNWPGSTWSRILSQNSITIFESFSGCSPRTSCALAATLVACHPNSATLPKWPAPSWTVVSNMTWVKCTITSSNPWSPTKLANCRFFPKPLWIQLKRFLCMTPWTLMSSNPIWSTHWHPWSTIVLRKVHALSNLPGCSLWITPARTPVRLEHWDDHPGYIRDYVLDFFAGEMIDKLTLTYNRTRQAVITGELIEIISGAAAL